MDRKCEQNHGSLNLREPANEDLFGQVNHFSFFPIALWEEEREFIGLIKWVNRRTNLCFGCSRTHIQEKPQIHSKKIRDKNQHHLMVNWLLEIRKREELSFCTVKLNRRRCYSLGQKTRKDTLTSTREKQSVGFSIPLWPPVWSSKAKSELELDI